MAMKKIISILLVAAMLSSLGICAYAVDVPADVVIDTNNGPVGDNSGTIKNNIGIVIDNNGTININKGRVDTNNGEVSYNGGLVNTNENDGKVSNNYGTVGTNNGEVINNNYGTVGTNNGTITDNNDTVGTNNGEVINNNGTVDTNSENGTVSQNYGTVTDNYGTVTDKENGSVTNNYGTEIKADNSISYGIVVEDSIDENNSSLVQFVKDVSQDLKSLFSREGYTLKGYEEEYDIHETTVYTATKPSTIKLIWDLFSGGNDEPVPTEPTTPPQPTTPPAKPEKPADNSESTYVVQMRAITYIKGSNKDLSTGVKADGAEVQIKLKGNAINDFEVINGEVVLSADYLEALNVGSYQICVIVSGVQTWLNLIVK